MQSYAQTNLHLYRQAISAGWGEEQLRCLLVTHDLAAQLFSARFRSSGKPFLAHLVGTASILLAHGARPALVAAGLLHAAYDQGEFGDGVHGPSAGKRAELRHTVGPEVEDLVARYTLFPWRSANLEAGADRDAMLLRASNELEETIDLGCLYSGENRRAGALGGLERAHQLADALRMGALGAEIAEARAVVAKSSLPFVLSGGRDGSFTLAPRSHRLKCLTHLRRRLDRWRRRLRGTSPPS